MNHGRLGYISDKRLRLSPDILDQFGLREGNVVFGVYYPRNRSDRDRERATVDDDFMLTPLFPPLWGRAGCLIIRIKQEPQAFSTIARFLANQNLSIYCSEYTRSGYRYGTWNLHVVVNGLEEPLTYCKKKSGYVEVISHLETATKRLEKQCQNVLFVDPLEPDLERPVKLLHLSALSYFAHHYLKTNKVWGRPFRLQVGKNGFLDDDQGFAEVLKKIKEQYRRDLRNSVFFVEADRRNYNMRLAVFPRSRPNSLFVARARYRSEGKWDDFRGLLARISESLPKTCNVWKCSNEKLDVQDQHERGIIKMILEDTDAGISREEKIRRIKQSFTTQGSPLAPCTTIEPPVIDLATISYCRRRFRHDFTKDGDEIPTVFISYHHSQRKKAKEISSFFGREGVQGWLDNKNLARGQWAEQIEKALARMDEFILLWTPQCKNSEWVTREWISALIYDVPITILLIRGRARSLPEQLRKIQAIGYDEKMRRNKALKDIADKMKHLALTRRD